MRISGMAVARKTGSYKSCDSKGPEDPADGT
jgi:hypothetical protein